MIKVSATNLRNKLFDYLDKAAGGEIIVIQRNNKEVARLISANPVNWREKMSIKPKVLVSPAELVEPIEDIWEDHT